VNKPVLRLVTCGSVDDGKSTLIGRLLVDTDSVPVDTVEAARTVRRTGSTVKTGSIDYSLLTDGLEAERDQGITIDVAYRSMNLLNGRRLIIADAPGHEQYTRNMAVAASRADLALVLIDVTRGIRTQTLRHLTICSIMGIKEIIFAVNKMDRVNHSEEMFNNIIKGLKEPIKRLEIQSYHFIPISALDGDNVSDSSVKMSWYSGPSLLDCIQVSEMEIFDEGHPQMNIQMISRSEDFRGLAGTVVGGSFSVGDEVVILPAKTPAKISQIITFEGRLQTASEGRAVTVVLEPDVDAARGDIVQLMSGAVTPADRFAATMVWLSDSSLVHSKSYYLMSGSTQVTAIVTRVKHVINVTNGEQNSGTLLKANEIGVVEVATDSLMALTAYKQNRLTGSFILVDRVTMNTVGAGMVTHALRRGGAYPSTQSEIDGAARAIQKNQKAKVVWFTGISGSGKSTIANALDKELFSRGLHTYVLDGDYLRLGVNKDLGFTREDRAESVRRASEVARICYDAGLITLVTLVSPFAEDRDQAKSLFPATDFFEVWVNTPIDVCEARDPKGLYKKSRSGELPNFTGHGQVYETPRTPALTIDGTKELKENLNMLMSELFGL
jgi:bifunctional enzyme CysN/CysC